MTCSPIHAPARPADYAEFVAEHARESAPELPTYSDLVRARRVALAVAREAQHAAAPDAPRLAPPMPCGARAPAREESPSQSAPATHAHVRRLVDVIDNRGSLIDLLL